MWAAEVSRGEGCEMGGERAAVERGLSGRGPRLLRRDLHAQVRFERLVRVASLGREEARRLPGAQRAHLEVELVLELGAEVCAAPPDLVHLGPVTVDRPLAT